MTRHGSALIASSLILVGLAAAPSTARDRNAVPAATPTGPAQSCVRLTELRESRVRNDRVIDFITIGRKAYRVTLPDACPGLGFERAFSYKTSLSELCQQDIITVFHQGPGASRGASCGLAPFQPIELADPRR